MRSLNMSDLPLINENSAILNQLREMQAQNEAFQLSIREEMQELCNQLRTSLTKIQTELQDRRTSMDTDFARFDRRIEAAEINSIARNINSAIKLPLGRLAPLRTMDNEYVDGFPATLGHLSRLTSGNVNDLLDKYSQTCGGSLEEKMNHLKEFIGVVNDSSKGE